MTILSSLPLGYLFESRVWVAEAIVTVTILCAIALICRIPRLPAWVPTVAMVAALPLILARFFPTHTEIVGIIPTHETGLYFLDLIITATQEIQIYKAPVPDHPGFLFLAVMGIGLVAILIDLCVVVLRHPAVCGLFMLALYSIPAAIKIDEHILIPFLISAAAFLWLIAEESIDRVCHYGQRFNEKGHRIGEGEHSPLVATGQRLAIVSLAIAVGIPLLVPGLPSQSLEKFTSLLPEDRGNSNSKNGGSGTTIGLQAMFSGYLNRGKAFDMVRVKTNDPNPYYLRFAVADEVTHTGFTHRNIAGGIPANGEFPQPSPPLPGVTQHPYHANIEIVKIDSHYLPLYQRPTRVKNLDSQWLYEPNTSILHSLSQSSRKKHYEFDYVRYEYTPEALRFSPRGSSTDSSSTERYLIDVPHIPEIATLVTQLTKNTTTQYDKVMSIFNYFSPTNGFMYSLKTEKETNENHIVDFLKNKKGFCVQYAASLAWLTRQAGYPARVAFGFSRNPHQQGNTFTLTNFNLHAWTEIYFPRYGWVPFDATPASGIQGAVNPMWAPNLDTPHTTNSLPPTPTTTPSTQQQPSNNTASRVAHREDNHADQLSTTASHPHPSRLQIAMGTGLLAAVILTMMSLPMCRRRFLRRRRLKSLSSQILIDHSTETPHPPNDPHHLINDLQDQATRHDTHEAWAELLDTMIDFGIPLDPAESPQATAKRLVMIGLPDAAATSATLLGQAEERARYAPRPMAANHLAISVKSIHTALRDQSHQCARLRARLFPSSVLTPWAKTVTRLAIRWTSFRR